MDLNMYIGRLNAFSTDLPKLDDADIWCRYKQLYVKYIVKIQLLVQINI